MTVSVQTPVQTYIASGTNKVFVYPFRILASGDLKVYFNGSLQSAGYTVSNVGNATGGNVTFTTAPASGTVVRLQREMDLLRSTDYVEGGALRADVLDTDIDRTVMMIQELYARQTSTDFDFGVNILGSLHVDTTPITTAWPVTITHSNVFDNAFGGYGRGTVLIQSTGIGNNQPLLMTEKDNNDSSLGNAANLVLKNKGTTAASTSAFDVDLEFVANNPALTAEPWGGKTELRQTSNRDTGDTRLRHGSFQISPRRADLHPSPNSGFEPTFFFLPNSSLGMGLFETHGNGVSVLPEYDYGTHSKVEVINPFQNSIWTNTASASGKSARLEFTGDGASWLRVITVNGQSTVYVDSQTGTGLVQIKGSSVSGTGSSNIEQYSGSKYWRVSHSGTSNNYSFQYNDGTTTKSNAEFSIASDGLLNIYRLSDISKGRIRLSNGSGAVGGGIVEYDSNTGVYTASGSRMTINSQQVQVATSSTTASRPTATAVGQSHFDTTLGKPIWWNGTVWKDATGATV